MGCRSADRALAKSAGPCHLQQVVVGSEKTLRIPIQKSEITGDPMKSNSILAFVLIALGIAAFAYQGLTYKTREKVVDLGPIQVTAEKTRTIPLSPVLGAAALLGGILLLAMGTRKTS
jgi:hypothetical protein